MSEVDVRTRILEEATRLFGRQGFRATSVQQVVDAAGVTKPTLYYYFDNKAALFLETVSERLAVLDPMVETLSDSRVPAVERLRGFVTGYLERALADLDGVRLMMTAYHPTDGDQPGVDVAQGHGRVVVAIAAVIASLRGAGHVRGEVDAESAALALLGACDIAVAGALAGAPVPDHYVDQLVDLFLHGVSSS